MRQWCMRNRRAVPDEYQKWNLTGKESMPRPTVVGAAALLVYPAPRGQVGPSVAPFFHQRGYEEVGAEHVLVLG